jgi:hypothetical protein
MANSSYSGSKGVNPGPPPSPYIKSNENKKTSPKMTESINWKGGKSS